jgi:Domain of unknown function (DUF4349)
MRIVDGDSEGSVADPWRELRQDVRALAPPIDPEFERRLGERIAERRARSAARQPRRRLGWLPKGNRLRNVAGAVAAVGVVVLALVIAIPRPGGTSREAVPEQQAPVTTSGAGSSSAGSSASKGPSQATESPPAGPSAPAFNGAAATPGRVQQRAASIRLSSTPSAVQSVADSVARLAVSYGGFVQSSQVQVQQQGTSEANVDLSLPSAKLSAALAALGQLAPVRAESQSLQDITNTYDAARQRLNDVTAERQALLHALARASTEGQIDSLRERLSQSRGAIARAGSAFQAVSHQASTAEVEVAVVGDARAGSEGLTLDRGLHDAGRVLVATLFVLLLAAAVLVPLALVLAALVTGRRAWRRYQRERVLDAR